MKSPSNEVSSVEYEMGFAADEFGNVLTGSFSGENSDYQGETLANHNWLISQKNSDLKITIKVTEMPPRRLGLFALPVLKVVFQMEKSVAEDQGAFFKRFFKYFHKGGG